MSKAGECPFWDAIGRHFFEMDFPQADSLSTINKKFIEDFMPRYPIYTSMLPEAAREVMGDVHPDTRPALAMLEAEGFEKINLIDIFDGGPVVQCRRDEIDAVQRTRAANVVQITEKVDGQFVILSSESDGFRAVLGNVADAEQGCAISAAVAQALRVRLGDKVNLLPLHPEKVDAPKAL